MGNDDARARALERWPEKWTPPEEEIGTQEREAGTRRGRFAPPASIAAPQRPLVPATLTCPTCRERLPTFVERAGPVEFYCVACRAYRLAVASEA